MREREIKIKRGREGGTDKGEKERDIDNGEKMHCAYNCNRFCAMSRTMISIITSKINDNLLK